MPPSASRRTERTETWRTSVAGREAGSAERQPADTSARMPGSRSAVTTSCRTFRPLLKVALLKKPDHLPCERHPTLRRFGLGPQENRLAIDVVQRPSDIKPRRLRSTSAERSSPRLVPTLGYCLHHSFDVRAQHRAFARSALLGWSGSNPLLASLFWAQH
jgi:hypothetical protein